MTKFKQMTSEELKILSKALTIAEVKTNERTEMYHNIYLYEEERESSLLESYFFNMRYEINCELWKRGDLN